MCVVKESGASGQLRTLDTSWGFSWSNETGYRIKRKQCHLIQIPLVGIRLMYLVSLGHALSGPLL